MIRNIDLTPATARARAARRASRRRWIAVYTVAALAGAGATGLARLHTASVARELARVTRQVERTAEEMGALAEITGELALIANTIELQATVAPRPSVPDVLREITLAAPPSMTLTSLLLDQRTSATTASIRAARRAGDDAPQEVATSVHIAGVAPDDAEIVRLIRAIDQSGMFRQTSLEYSRPVTVRGREAREFKLVATAPTVSTRPQKDDAAQPAPAKGGAR